MKLLNNICRMKEFENNFWWYTRQHNSCISISGWNFI